jgi:hypothetical protein
MSVSVAVENAVTATIRALNPHLKGVLPGTAHVLTAACDQLVTGKPKERGKYVVTNRLAGGCNP